MVEQQVTRMKITVNLQSPFVSEAPGPIANMVMRDRFDNYLLGSPQPPA